MFIWDFLVSDVMNQIYDWMYGWIIGFFTDFFAQMGDMGSELFDLSWVQSVILFFSYLAWALYVTGLVVAVFETAIEASHGRASIKDTALNAIKGFLATSLFTVAPVELYKLSIHLQRTFSAGLTGYGSTIGELSAEIATSLGPTPPVDAEQIANVLGGLPTPPSGGFLLFVMVMIGYAIIKVFFANLKRSGILLIQIAVGSLYMFSVPRGYMDGFMLWCKQVIGLCLTTFLQATILTAGLLALKDNVLLGLGLMLSATEVPRIAGAFGVDTSTKGSFSGAVSTANMAINTTRAITQVVAR